MFTKATQFQETDAKRTLQTQRHLLVFVCRIVKKSHILVIVINGIVNFQDKAQQDMNS